MTSDNDRDYILSFGVAQEDVNKVAAVSERIVKRNSELDANSRSNWLHTGRDLQELKGLVGHGNFEELCQKKIGFAKRTIEKLMRAADVLGPHLKSVPDALLRKASLAYMISARNVSAEVFDEYLPRIIRGEKGIGPKLRKALNKAKPPLVEAVQLAALVHGVTSPLGPQDANSVSRDRLAAVNLIVARLADQLPAFLELIDLAGPGTLVSDQVRDELRRRCMGPVGTAVSTGEMDSEGEHDDETSNDLKPEVLKGSASLPITFSGQVSSSRSDPLPAGKSRVTENTSGASHNGRAAPTAATSAESASSYSG